MKRRRNLFPKACRLLARLLLFVGLIVLAGNMALVLSECFSPSPDLPSSTPPSLIPPDSSGESVFRTSYLIWLIIILGLFIVGFIISIRQFNNFARKLIDKIAHIFTLPIFATEIVLTILIWGGGTALLLIIYPLFAIFAALAMLINLVLFALAWLAYRRPQYKI